MQTGFRLFGRLPPLAAGLLLLFVPGACSQMDAAADAARDFLRLVGEGRVDEAYRSAAPALHAIQAPADFSAAVRRVGLHRVEGVRVTGVRARTREATVEATVTLRPAGERKVVVRLVPDRSSWKVFSVRLEPAVEGAAALSTVTLLTDSRVAALAQRSLLDFAEAVLSADFTSFHAGLAAPFRAEHDAESLAGVFSAFVEGEIDIRGIVTAAPMFDAAPAVGENGRLTVRGHYPTRPSQVAFDLVYSLEEGAWRLFALRVSVEPARE